MRHKKYFILGGLFVVVVVAGSFFYWHWPYQPSANYLIEGVPYYGPYSHFFETEYSLVTSVASILGYWGDDRFSLADIEKELPPGGSANNVATIVGFFEQKGYLVSQWIFPEAGKEIDQIKKLVNAEKKVPVIIYQKQAVFQKETNNIGAYRVVIGISDKDKKVIVHDYNFGNNYEISYGDFEKMFQLPDFKMIIAVKPPAALLALLKMETPQPYPARIEAMDKVGHLFLKRSEAFVFYKEGNYQGAVEVQAEIINDPAFSYFPPAYKVFFISLLGKYLVLADKPDEAIDIIMSEALPLNKDLNKPYGGWEGQVNVLEIFNLTENRQSIPYRWLGEAYLKKGDKELARKNFEEALKINPDNSDVRQMLESLNQASPLAL